MAKGKFEDQQRFQSTPPARGATSHTYMVGFKREFQSTPPARGATRRPGAGVQELLYFNPRPPRGGRLKFMVSSPVQPVISIHAPREGGDPGFSALPGFYNISIHAPREGGDTPTGSGPLPCANISIHAPREGGDSAPA